MRFDEGDGFPVPAVEDVPVEETEGTDGLFEERFGIMFIILHGQQILPEFFFIDLLDEAATRRKNISNQCITPIVA